MKWNAENIDASYRDTVGEFLEGDDLAARQGIPDFIEEYRVSRVKGRIAPLIIDAASNSDARILDAGCGHGWYPLSLAVTPAFKAALICVDISTHNIELLKAEAVKRGLSEKVSAEVANCEKLPFENESFDLVYTTESVEHMEFPERFFLEAARVLKPGGILIVTTPSGPMHRFWTTLAAPFAATRRFFKVKKSSGPRATSNKIYERALSKKELLNGLAQAGFEIRDYSKSVYLPHESYFQFLPLWLLRLLLFRAKIMEKLAPITSWSALHHVVVASSESQ